SVHARDRRPFARADRNLLAGDRESDLWHAASARRRLSSDPHGVAVAASWSGVQPALSPRLCLRNAAGGPFLILRRSSAGLQRQPNSHRFDVQHGIDSDDLFWLHLLSMERSGALSHPAKSRPDKPSGLRERGTAWHARAPVPASSGAGSADSVDGV